MDSIPLAKQHSVRYFNEMVVRGMRAAATSQRAHRSEQRSEARAIVHRMMERRNDCTEPARRKQMSKDKSRARRRARRQRALASALRPRRQREKQVAGIQSLRDAGGAPLAAPRQIFDAVNEFASAEWGRGESAESHLARAVGEVRWKVMEGQGGRLVRSTSSMSAWPETASPRGRCAPGETGLCLSGWGGVADEVCGRF